MARGVDVQHLRDPAYAAIRGAIVRARRAPAREPRARRRLAERLGLSRALVREALARLAGEGLVETEPQSYRRVTGWSCARCRATAHGRGHRRDARGNHRFGSATRVLPGGEALRPDVELHDVLVRTCGNRAVVAMIAHHTPLIRRLEWRLEWRRFPEGSALQSAELHERLIDACVDGDGVVRVTARGSGVLSRSSQTNPTVADLKELIVSSTQVVSSTQAGHGRGLRCARRVGRPQPGA